MNKFQLNVFLFFSALFAGAITEVNAQRKPFKEIVIDLDKHRLDSVLPVEEPFYIKFISANTFNLSNFRIIRVRKRKSYIPFSNKQVLYYKDIHLPNVGPVAAPETFPKASKVTTTSSTKTTAAAPEVTSTTVSEYPGSPKTVAYHSATVFIPAFTPNFYYYLINVPVAIDLDNVDLFAEIELPTTTPMGNTALDPNENLNRHITATFGLTYVSLHNKTIVPYLGLRYNFLPVNKWVRYGMSEMSDPQKGSRLLDRLAVEVGLTLGSLEDTVHKIKDLTGKLNVQSGVGYRISNLVYVSGGAVWYKRIDDADKTKTLLKRNFYVSLSLDWDIAKTFNSFGKLLGIAY